jgi:hypothetical protein
MEVTSQKLETISNKKLQPCFKERYFSAAEIHPGQQIVI